MHSTRPALSSCSGGKVVTTHDPAERGQKGHGGARRWEDPENSTSSETPRVCIQALSPSLRGCRQQAGPAQPPRSQAGTGHGSSLMAEKPQPQHQPPQTWLGSSRTRAGAAAPGIISEPLGREEMRCPGLCSSPLLQARDFPRYTRRLSCGQGKDVGCWVCFESAGAGGSIPKS